MTVPRQKILQWRSGRRARTILDELAEEEPLEIRVDTAPVSLTMRTPGHDEELAAGFLITEGVIAQRKDLADIKHYLRNEEGNVIDVFLKPHVALDLKRLTRHVFASSSCGLCGKATIDAIRGQFAPVRSRWKIEAETLLRLPSTLRKAQSAFQRTGGLHASALFTPQGKLVVVREDVGRHNALDKVIGHCLLHASWPLHRFLLLVSGRVSFEIMQKALSARIPVVAAISAPSSLAVEFARSSGQTLVGFLRPGKMNIYTHGQRIHTGSASPS